MIDTVALKNRILNLAIEGKLSEQLETDGNADSIAIDIDKQRKERAEQGKEKYTKIRSVNNTIAPFNIPKTWRWFYISDMSIFQEGPGILAKDFRKEGISLIRIAGMNSDVLSLEGCNYLDPEMVEEKWNHFKLDIGDIVISTSASLDRICEVTDETAGAIPYTGQIRFKMLGGIEKDYFKIFIKSPFYMQQINDQKQGGFISHYGPTHLKKMIIPVPPIEEQKRIVKKANAVIELVEIINLNQNKYAKNLEILKSKIIDAGIQGKLTEQLTEDGTAEELLEQIAEEKKQLIKEKKIKATKALPEITEDEIPFEIPDNWKWVRLSEIMDVRDGTHDSPKYVEEGIPLVTSKNISSGGLDFTNVNYISQDDANKINERSNVDTGDILFAMIGTIGNPVIVEKNREFCIKNVALFKNFAKDKLDIRYMYWMLMREQYVMKKKAIGGLQPFISLKVFREYVVPLPPIAEQRRIADRLDEVISMC